MNESVRVLLVEDNTPDVDLIREMLPGTGPVSFSIESVPRLGDALARLKGGAIDVILLDLGLPDSQGLETFFTLHREAPAIPIIVLTGNDNRDTAVTAVREGAQDFLIKGQFSGNLIERAVQYAMERKRGVAELEERALLLNALVNSAGDTVIFSLDRNCRYTSFNEKHREEMRRAWNAEISVGASLPDLMADPEHRAQTRHSIDRALGGEAFTEIRHQPQTGTWYEFSWNPIRLAGGEVVGVTAYIRDVTDRKRIEELLAETSRRLEMALQLSGAGSWDWDVVTGRIKWSPSLFEILGLDPRSTAASFESWRGALHPADVEIAESRIEKALKERTPLDSDYRVIMPDGRIRWINATGTGVYDAQGQPISMLGICLDITERKRIEEALRESERNLKEAQRLAQLGHWRWNVRTGEVEWSEEVFRIFCRDADTFTPQIDSILALSPWPEDHERDKELIRRAMETREPGSYDQRFLRPDGSTGYYHSTFRGEYDAGGDLVFIVGTVQDITERKLTEEKLSMAYGRLRRFIDSNMIGVAIAAADGRIIETNEYFLNMMGYSREEFDAGKVDWREITPPEWLPADEKALGELSERGICTPYEKEYARRDGTRVTVYIADAMLPGPEQHIAAIIIDITDRRRAEQALRILSARQEAILEAVPDIIMEVDTGKVYTWANKAGLEFFGEDVLGKEAAFFFEGEQDTYRTVQPIFDGGGVVIYVESWQRRKDGHKRLLAWWCRILKNDRGEITGALSSARDITDLHQAEADLAESERKFRSLFSSMEEGVALHELVCDEAQTTVDYRVIEVNPAYERHTGIPAQRARGASGSALYGGGTPPYLREYERVARGGEPLTFESWFAPLEKYFKITVISPQPGRFATVFEDITERKRQEEELRLKNAELERFTYTISHDLKAPLVTIKTFLGYLEEDRLKEDDGRIEKDLSYLRAAGDKMGALLEELLEMSRIGRVVNVPERVTFRELVEEALAAVAGSIAERGVEVRVGDGELVLFGDRRRLAEIWQNLVENAVKFMGGQASPRIDIGLEPAGKKTVFFVRDNGMGIDPRHHEKIFGLFNRLDLEIKGTGLGLALVKRIVELHGGRIGVDSQGAGRGASFRFTLPSAIMTQQEGGTP